jgi:hypothetical protein
VAINTGNEPHSKKRQINGLSVVEASHLIPLKSRAWLDLLNRENPGADKKILGNTRTTSSVYINYLRHQIGS